MIFRCTKPADQGGFVKQDNATGAMTTALEDLRAVRAALPAYNKNFVMSTEVLEAIIG